MHRPLSQVLWRMSRMHYYARSARVVVRTGRPAVQVAASVRASRPHLSLATGVLVGAAAAGATSAQCADGHWLSDAQQARSHSPASCPLILLVQVWLEATNRTLRRRMLRLRHWSSLRYRLCHSRYNCCCAKRPWPRWPRNWRSPARRSATPSERLLPPSERSLWLV
eukprot:SAG11_NODE_10759_length_807_cov_1.384181_2_plen_166_part_01